MKFVFLDIDGVLNRGGMYQAEKLEKDLVNKLNCLVHPEVQFILTSSWGLRIGLQSTIHHLQQHGFKGFINIYLYGDTPRRERIDRFLQANTHSDFVVLDDHNIGGPGHILIDPNVGLTDNDVDKARSMINI